MMITYGGISVLNAIPTGIGAVIPIDLPFSVTIISGNGPIEEEGREIIQRALKTNPEGIRIMKRSSIPRGMGLKSSSAYTTCLLGAYSEFMGLDIPEIEIARLSSKVSKEMGISITGAFDDALSSITSKFVVADASRNEVLRMESLEKKDVIIVLPPYKRPNDIEERLMKVDFSDATQLVLRGEIERGAIMNGYLVGRALGYPTEPLDEILSLGPQMAGYTGNGPAIYAIVDDNNKEKVRRFMSELGAVMMTETR